MMTGAPGSLLIRRREVAALLGLDECIAAVEQAFEMHERGRTLPPGVLGVPAQDGGFHIKAAGLKLEKTYFAVKVNGNFFHNRERHGMPNIQGIIVLCDGENGLPLALLDSIEITILRTGAATAVAAKHLARPGSEVATICGCGNQGRVQLRSLSRVLHLKKVHAFDTDVGQAQRLAAELGPELGLDVQPVLDLSQAVQQSDVVVTCTPSRRAFLRRQDVRPGTFIAAVGADNDDKQELEPELVAASRVVPDILEQCATIGELHHALAAGLVTRAHVQAELGEIVAGLKPGRTSDDEIIVFDSTGTALQDVAAAVAVYEKASREGIRLRLNFAE